MKPSWRRFVVPIAILASVLATLWLAGSPLGQSPAARSVAYSEISRAARAGELTSLDFSADHVRATRRPPDGAGKEELLVAERLPGVDDPHLLEALQTHGATVTGHTEKGGSFWPVVLGIAPFVLLPILFWLTMGGLARRGGGGRPMSFGKSQAKIYDRSGENRVTFADVAGVEEAKAELLEVVDFLREPAKYRSVGARVPKGVLLVGPPGTGKTLLARAVAGESGVPFFSMSGSEFVEMFVGVGASRVRDLFEQAKERGPCIVFIDELDAVGKSRAGAAGFAANEEREQTLNQLLVEMDGFDSGSGLVIMAATNRPEILDRALLRAGRFDRQVLVDRPDVRGREAILGVHAKKVQLGPDVDLRVIAQRTPGMVGADLANVVNEAALASVRRASKAPPRAPDAVSMRDFEEAIDRIQLGLKKEGRVMTDDEKRRVAFHEAGHALVALSVEHSDPVHRVTIIPRSIGALGATLQLPTDERYLMTRAELRDRICVLLGGRAAEELVCDDISTGAENDLERATETARLMVCRFGMSDALGPQTFGRPGGARFLQLPVDLGDDRNFSEETARVIDAEVRGILVSARERSRALIVERRAALDAIARELLACETIERAQLEALVTAHAPSSGRWARDARPATRTAP